MHTDLLMHNSVIQKKKKPFCRWTTRLIARYQQPYNIVIYNLYNTVRRNFPFHLPYDFYGLYGFLRRCERVFSYSLGRKQNEIRQSRAGRTVCDSGGFFADSTHARHRRRLRVLRAWRAAKCGRRPTKGGYIQLLR